MPQASGNGGTEGEQDQDEGGLMGIRERLDWVGSEESMRPERTRGSYSCCTAQ